MTTLNEKGTARSGANSPVLVVEDMEAGYGDSTIVRDLSFEVSAGEIVCFIGPNGSGKSTVLKAVMAQADLTGGRVQLVGDDLDGAPTEERVRRGAAFVPQTDNIFRGLTIEENLIVGATVADRSDLADSLESAYLMFPMLRERRTERAWVLSGGERQMLALARALMVQPRLLLLDEPTAALAPTIREELLARVRTIADTGIAVLLVEQNVAEALESADWACVLAMGRLVMSGAATTISNDDELRRIYMGGK